MGLHAHGLVFLVFLPFGIVSRQTDDFQGLSEDVSRIYKNTSSLGCLLTFQKPNTTVRFFLYTKFNKNEAEQLWLDSPKSLRNSHFDKTKKTLVVIHGFDASYETVMPQSIKNALLKYEDDNVILVDWSPYVCLLCYITATIAEPHAGRYVGDFLYFLIQNGLSPSSLHIIGHSLGAHAAGFAGKQLKHHGYLIPRITGLDPALPGYEPTINYPNDRIDKDDAEFVDCIHSDGGCLGIAAPICGADFYANGGVAPQPGCSHFGNREASVLAKCLCPIDGTIENCDLFSICAHQYSYMIFAESINKKRHFPAERCQEVDENGHPHWCWKMKGALMGYHADPRFSGSFYLKTPPFSLDSYIRRFRQHTRSPSHM